MNRSWLPLVRLELKLFAAQRVTLGALLVLALALPSSLAWQNAQLLKQQSMVQAAAQRGLSAWHGQALKNAHLAAHFGSWAFRPASALQGLDPGLTHHVGVATFLEAHKRNMPTLAAVDTGQLDGSAPQLSPALLAKTVFPLLMLVMGLALGRREASRFDLDPLRVAGASARGVLVVQATLLMGLAVAVLFPLAAYAAVEVGPGLPLLLWLLACAGLQVSFAWTGLAMGRWAGARRGALLAGLLFWAAVALVLPRCSMTLAQVVEPTSRLAQNSSLKQALAKEVDGHGKSAANAAFRAGLLARYGVATEAELPVNADALLMQADELVRSRVFATEVALLRTAFDRQDRLIALLGLASPLMAYERLSMALTQTDRHALQDHEGRVEVYRQEMISRLNDDMAHNTRTGDWKTAVQRELFTSLPLLPGVVAADGAVWLRMKAAWFGQLAWLVIPALSLLLLARTASSRGRL